MIPKISLLVSLLIMLSSCTHRLVGTWTIQKFETASHDEQGVSLTNIGKITFNRNGSGGKSLNYSVLGITRDDHMPFRWRASEHMVTIDGENTELAKSWIQVIDKKKFQQWKSTDGTQVQILELKK